MSFSPAASSLLGQTNGGPSHSLGHNSAGLLPTSLGLDSSAGSSSYVVCQNCNKLGHMASFCQFNYSPSGQANFAQASMTGIWDMDWCVDSGAAHHVTSDSANLHIKDDYTSPNNIFMGDGKPLPSFTSDLQHFHHLSKIFISIILFTHHISKRLLSISK